MLCTVTYNIPCWSQGAKQSDVIKIKSLRGMQKLKKKEERKQNKNIIDATESCSSHVYKQTFDDLQTCDSFFNRK